MCHTSIEITLLTPPMVSLFTIGVTCRGSVFNENRGSVFSVDLHLVEVGRYSEAVDEAKKVLQLSPNDAAAYDNLGIFLFRQGEYGQAEEAFRKAIDLDPRLDSAYCNQASLFLEQGKDKAAADALRKAIDLNPRNPLSHCKMGICLAKLGRHDEALAAYIRAVELEPRFSSGGFPLPSFQDSLRTGTGAAVTPKIRAEESCFGLMLHENRLYYADGSNSYVLQIEPSPAAWKKNSSESKWRRTRKVPVSLESLSLCKLYLDPIAEFDFSKCGLLRWRAFEGKFQYEPDPDDSLPIEVWTAYFDWGYLVEKFFDSVPGPLLEQLKKFRAGCWELLEASYQWDGFSDLLTTNPALAVCLAMRIRVGGNNGERRKRLDYGKLVRLRQRDIAAAIGFGDSESTVAILKKIVPDACAPSDLATIYSLMSDPEVVPHLRNARHISNPAILMMNDYYLRGKLGGELITQIAEAFPRVEDIIGTADGVKQLRGGSKQQEFMDLLLELRDVVQFAPGSILHSMGDFKSKQEAMIKKVNAGSVGKSKICFPNPPFPGTEHIHPITTAKELESEGREMNHCAGSYALNVANHQVAVYRVTFPERATLSIERDSRGWYLAQLKLKDNQNPADETVNLVDKWLKENRIRKRRAGNSGAA